MTPILSKSFCLIQVARCSSILTLRICFSLCDAVSSLTRMSLRTRPRIIAKYVTIKQTSHSGKLFFRTLNETQYLELMFTCGPPCSKLSPQSLGSLAILALAALLRPMSPRALALSSKLSIGGVFDRDAPRGSFNPADVLPSCLAGVMGFSSVLPPLSRRVPWRLLWWYSPRAPSTGGTLHIGAPSQRSQSVPRPVLPHVQALLLALLTGLMISLLAGR